MKKKIMLGIAIFAICAISVDAIAGKKKKKQNSQDKTRPCFVEVLSEISSINLKFVVADKYKIYRKFYDELKWGEPIYETTDAVDSWQDKNVKEGVLYEYMIVGKDDKPTINKEKPGGYIIHRGYVSAGINVDNTNHKGKVILLVEKFIVIH